MQSFGIYVHFPWCLQKCPYCDFFSIAKSRPEIPQEAYTAAILREISARRAQLGQLRIHSIFVGGGTPSLWEPAKLGQVLDKISQLFSLEPEIEVTVECNPSSFSKEHARQIVSAGANRVSIGVQSLNAERLKFLGRLHDGPAGLSAVRQALDGGVPRVSADLIYGVYSQDADAACAEVSEVASLGVSHLSAYALTIEPGTAFGAQSRKGQLPLLADDQVARSFSQVSETLTGHGFEHYEISNFARSGQRSRHNVGYWRGEPYLGIGSGAWGTLPGAPFATRYRNTVVVERYMGLGENGTTTELGWPDPRDPNAVAELAGSGKTYQQIEPLSQETLLSERLMLGLRLSEGVDLRELEADLGNDVRVTRRAAIAKLQARGRLALEGDRLWIPKDAWLLADGTIAELL
ncbi:MAG: hypothetical protein RJA70_3801 [Pseudomonadota bacterium]|jgi:oxygen-independent coproporphyrinogen-3 oxidase